MYRFGPFRFDPAEGLDSAAGPLHLTPKSMGVLSLLLRTAGQVVTKDEIFGAVWPDTAVSDAALTSCIQELRSALQDHARRPRYIETVHRRGFRFIAPVTGTAPASMAAAEPGTNALVGREAVLEGLHDALHRTRTGRRQLVIVSGPPGIGKTTALQAFLQSAAASDVTIAGGGCVEQHGAVEPYGPMLEALGRLGRQPGGARAVATLAHFAPSWLAQLPALQSPAEYRELQRQTAGATRDRMLRELNDALEQLALSTPLVLWLEDLHWADAATVDWIVAFAQRPDPARVLLIGTLRRGQADAGRAAVGVLSELRVKGLCVEIELTGLEPHAFSALVAARHPPAPRDEEAIARLAVQVRALTDGNPLFGTHVLTDLVARGLLVEQAGRWRVADAPDRIHLDVPPDVRRVIERQLERLTSDERELLQAASVAGITWPAALAAAAAGKHTADVERVFAGLSGRECFVAPAGEAEWPDGALSGCFRFTHSLYREVIHAGLPAGRRAELHLRAGLRLEQAYGDRAAELAPELAAHFEQGRELSRAVLYLGHTARAAARLSALAEAEGALRHALALMEALPAGPARDEREIELRVELGAVLMARRGWGAPEVESAYLRARELCGRFDDPPHLFSAIWGLWLFYWGRGSLTDASALADTLLAMARRSGERGLQLQAAHALWATSFSKGDLDAAHAHASAGVALYIEREHAPLASSYGNHDAGVCARVFDARALALLGRDDEAVQAVAAGIALARRLEHAFTLVLALVFAAAVHQFRQDAAEVARHASEAAGLARAHSFPLLLAWAMALEGWAQVHLGASREGLALITEGLERAARTGSQQFRPHLLGAASEAYLRAGRMADARACLDQALALTARGGECFYLAELHRLDAELHRAAGEGSAARQALEQAVAVARAQGAALFEARSERRLKQW